MKSNSVIIVSALFTTLSFNTMAETPVSKTTNNKNDYVTITGYLGTRLSEDVKDPDTGAVADLSSELTQAIAIGWDYERNSEGELLFSSSKQHLTSSDSALSGMDVYIQYLHFGGKIIFKDEMPFSTNIGLGIGGTYFNPSKSSYDSDLKFSANISAGIRYQLSERFALRGDARVYGTLLNSDSQLFCSNNDCYINIDGNIYVQAELMAGLEYKF